jgi:hypothetical protein
MTDAVTSATVAETTDAAATDVTHAAPEVPVITQTEVPAHPERIRKGAHANVDA